MATVSAAATSEIPAATSGRKRAIKAPTPTGKPPVSAVTGAGRRSRASVRPSPNPRSPGSTPSLTLHEIVRQLVELQKRRVFTIKEENGSVSRIESLLVSAIGHDQSEKSKKAAFARVRSFRLAVEKGGDAPEGIDARTRSILIAYIPLIIPAAKARKPWRALRDEIVAEMETLARQLPAAEFVASTRGMGWAAFAVTQAESGRPLAEWDTVSGLWKHMGYAVIDGKRQRGISGKRKDEEEARKLFFPAERKGQLYSFLQDSVFRAQWNAERLKCAVCAKSCGLEWSADAPVCEACETPGDPDDVIPAHAAGPYGEVYGMRRAHTMPRILATDSLDNKDPAKWTKRRCHNDATRIMAKALLRDLWRVSRGLPPRGSGPPDIVMGEQAAPLPSQ